MNLPYFISKKIRKEGHQFSTIVHRVAVLSVTIGLGISIISFLIMHGFQQEVKRKIYAFSGQLLLTKYSTNASVEETSFAATDSLMTVLSANPAIEQMQKYAHQGALIKTKEETQGVVFKGLEASPAVTRWLSPTLVAGRLIHFNDTTYSREVMIGQALADKLKLKIGDDIVMYFFQQPPRYRKLRIVGIYVTDLSEYFDEKVIIGDIGLLRQLNQWDAKQVGGIQIWLKDQPSSMVDLWAQELNRIRRLIPSTEKLEILSAEWRSLQEVFWNNEYVAHRQIRRQISESIDFDLSVETLQDKYPDLFDWLNIIERQVRILLAIILIVISVNMIAIMLIVVIDKTSMIGLLKALGGGNNLILRIFLFYMMNLMARCLFFGNILGIGGALLQSHFHLISLNSNDYFMDTVPIAWSWETIILLNVLMAASVFITLFIPFRLILRLSPVNAIKFD